MFKKYTVINVMMVFLLILTACGSNNEESQKQTDNEQEAQPSVDIDEDELMPKDKVIAVVNGKEVNGKTYNIVYSQLKLSANQMGGEVDLDEMKQATLDSLIDRELLMQDAKDEGIEITDERAEEELATIKDTNQEGLTNLLEQYQMSEDDFKEQLKFELALTEYKENLDDVEVTEQELKDNYNKAKEGSDEMPDFEEVKPQMEQRMKEQKVNEALEAKIDKVKENSDIEKKMEI